MIHSFSRRRRRVFALGLLALSACGKNATEPSEVFTHPTGNRITTLPLAGRPHGVAVARSGTFYVSQIDNASATRGTVSAEGQSFSGTVSVGDAPAHVALSADGSSAYTTNQYGNSLSAIDVATNQLVATIPLSDGGFNLLAAPGGGRVYATTASGTLHIIDPAALRVVSTLNVGGAANGLAFVAKTNVLYVSSRDAGTVTAINAATNQVVRTYQVSSSPQRIAAARDGSAIYIASESVGLEVLNPSTGERYIVGGVGPGAVGLALSPDGVQLYVANPPAGLVHIVDVNSSAIVMTLRVAARPRNVAFDYSGTTALITDEAGAVVFVR